MMTTTTTPPDKRAPGPASTNVNATAGPEHDASIWTASRVIALAFTVLEVLLLVRFTLKLFGANAGQPLASAIYGVTELFVAPFRGIFAQPAGTPVFEIATILAIIAYVLLAALVVALVRAVTGRQGLPKP